MDEYTAVSGQPVKYNLVLMSTKEGNGMQAIKIFKGSGTHIDEEKNTGGFSCGQLAVTTKDAVASALLFPL